MKENNLKQKNDENEGIVNNKNYVIEETREPDYTASLEINTTIMLNNQTKGEENYNNLNNLNY